MRFALPTALLFTSLAPAAPVPDAVKADKKRLEAIWNDLASDDELVQLRSAFALIEEPGATAFLAKRCPPVKASVRELKGWLTDLNSEDKGTATVAFEYLQHFHPRIGLTPTEQIELVTTDRAARHLIRIWKDEWKEVPPEWLDQAHDFQFRIDTDCTDGRTVAMKCDLGVSGQRDILDQFMKLPDVGDISSAQWRRAEVAAEVLYLIGSNASRVALERLAGGHPDALPTRTAAELLKRKPEEFTMQDEHNALEWLLPAPRINHLQALISLSRTPDWAKSLKGKLPAMTTVKEVGATSLAVLALERIGTADAKEVLKQLADGLRDIPPTREAKAALERLKAK